MQFVHHPISARKPLAAADGRTLCAAAQALQARGPAPVRFAAVARDWLSVSSMRIPPIAIVAVVLGAGTIAVLHAEPARAPVAIVQPGVPAQAAMPGNAPEGVLPPNHPDIHGAGAGGGTVAAPTDQASITWTVPAGWKTVPNPNSMRIATYVVTGPDGDAEVTVSRAGGTPEANIERWLGQFDEAGKDVRAVKTIRGVKVSTVEVAGTYSGGGMGPGKPAGPHPGWALSGAIVEAPGSPYFFKMIGGKGTVRGAHASFDALLASITPS